MTYAEASRIISRSATAVSGFHLTLLDLNVALMTSALLYVYVTDSNANCGARFLTKYAGDNIIASGGLAILAIAIAGVYTTGVQGCKLKEKTMSDWELAIFCAAFFALIIITAFFFGFAISQLSMLGSPPALPKKVVLIQRRGSKDVLIQF